MAPPFRFDRTWTFPIAPAAFWAVVSRTDAYPRWWTWLRSFEIPDGAGLRSGVVAECVVQAPLPYALRFAVNVDAVVATELVATTISGDLVGPARLEVCARDGGCAARLAWSLELRDPVLRRLAVVTRPAMVWAHDRIVDMGVTQFERRALGGGA